METLDETLWARLGDIPLMDEGESVFSEGPAYWVNAKQVAHLMGPGVLELRLTKAAISERRAALKADPRVELRRSGSDWLLLRFTSDADIEFAAHLAAVAALAHAPAGGAERNLPPTGADLERRRRFH